MRNLSMLLILFVSINILPTYAQEGPVVPETGLTLSGGGAKGLAHIGILKALDSAGVKIDYVSGTSMGSIVGALYATGRSGAEIEQLARGLDWDLLLSNQINLRSIAMEEKDAYWAFAVEVPFEKGKFRGRTGALESQELWLKLSELFFPVYREKKFDQFYRPFRAVATDIATGEPFSPDNGEIIAALRASMAIPAVFTAIEIDGKRLVDGGIVRNLPVSEVKNLGADFVFASNVSEGMYTKERLTNPIQILTQIAFLKDGEDHKRQIALSDILINHALDPFSTGSFDKAGEIIDSGIVKGMELVPYFKKLADSLGIQKDSIKEALHRKSMPDSVYIISAQVEGLQKESAVSFLKGLKFETKKYYTPDQISALIRRTFGTLKYQRIQYRLIPKDPGKAIIVFQVRETPPTLAQLSVHFNTFSGLSLIGGFSSRNLLLPNSKTRAILNFGESTRFKIEHLQYLGRANRVAFVSSLQSEIFEVIRYEDFNPDEIYQLFNSRWDNRIQAGSRRNFTFGVGNRFERIRFTPFTQSSIEFDGLNNMFASYLFADLNTLDKPLFPDKGAKFYAELRHLHGQKQRVRYYVDDQQIEPNTPLALQEDNYFQGQLHLEWYHPVNDKLTFTGLLQGGFSTNRQPDVFNSFIVGGIRQLYRNQITFPGIPDYGTRAGNILALQLGMRKEFANNLYLTAGVNGLALDYLAPETQSARKDYILGQSLSVSYDSLMGPISFSIMYSGKVKKIEPYVNIGFAF